MESDDFSVIEGVVPMALYRQMRLDCGLSPRSQDAVRKGLLASLFMVHVKKDDQIVGMGRVIGDGGCFCQVVDICVLPSYQGQGLGKRIMSRIMKYVDEVLPATCYVSLIADGDAYKLYERYGFKSVWPASRGMFFRVK